MTDLTCEWKDRVESRMTPRLRTSGDGEMKLPSTWRRKSPAFLCSALGATTKSSVLLLLSLSRLEVNQVFMSRRQLTRDWGGSWVDGEVLRYSWVSSA